MNIIKKIIERASHLGDFKAVDFRHSNSIDGFLKHHQFQNRFLMR